MKKLLVEMSLLYIYGCVNGPSLLLCGHEVVFDARWKRLIMRRVVRSGTSYTRPFFSRNESADAHVHKVVSHTPAPICLPSYYTKVFPSLGADRIYDDISFSQPQTQRQTALWQIKTKSSRSLLISTKSLCLHETATC